jgi:hypothetical protein
MSDDIVTRLRGWIPCYRADTDVAVDIANAADEIERLRKWTALLQEQNQGLRERVTMLAEAAAEDAQRVQRLEAIIAKKEPL